MEIRGLKPMYAVMGIMLGLFSSGISFAASNSQTFTYQGRFLNAAGTAPLKEVVDLTFTIYNPAANCLLYQETQTSIDLTPTNGMFSTQVGSITGAAKRTVDDPHLPMSQIFSNGTLTRAPGTNCGAGYTGAAGDARVLRVTVVEHSSGTSTTIAPDLTINSVPQAQTAESIQGLAPSDFIQAASGVSGQANVSLATLLTLTGGGDASTLHNHDGRYVRTGVGATYANLGTGAYTTGNFGIGTTSPTGNLGFAGNSGSQSILVDRNSIANSSGSALNVQAGGATTGGTNQAGGNLVLSSGVSTGNAGSAITFQTSNTGSSGTGDNSVSTKMTLTSAGKLGVNTATPGAQLEVDSSGANTIGAIIKGFAAQVSDLFQVQDNTGAVVAKISPTGNMTLAGPLTLPGSPTGANDAATKSYVDSAIVAAATGVASFNTRTGAVVLSSTDVTTALTYTPLKNTTDTLTGILTVMGQFQSTSTTATSIGAVIKGAAAQSADLLEFQNSGGAVLSKVDKDGVITLPSNPTSGLHAATKAYVDTAIATAQPSGNYLTALTSDVSAAGPGSATATVNSVGTSSAANIHAAELAANAATSANTMSTIVKRDASGNFSAGTITGNLTGNVTGASSLNVLKTGDTISGTLGVGGAVGANTQLQSTATAATQIGEVIKGAASQSADLFQLQDSTGAVLAKFDKNGMLILPAIPTSSLGAATKSYVDSAVSGIVTSSSGTAGYVSQYTSASALGNSPIFVSGTSIGIGTTTPGAKFTVAGLSWLNRPSAKVDNNSAGADIGGEVDFTNTDFANGANSYLRVTYPDTSTIRFGSDYDGHLTGTTLRNIQFGRTGTPYLHIDNSSGNIGVGSTTPVAKLNVAIALAKTTAAGLTTSFQSTNDAANAFGLRTMVYGGATITDRYVTLQTTDWSLLDGGGLILQPAAGNVGIGTTTPASKLDVAGTINAIDYKLNGTSIASSLWTAAGSDTYRASGNVGVGTSSTNVSGFTTATVETIGSSTTRGILELVSSTTGATKVQMVNNLPGGESYNIGAGQSANGNFDIYDSTANKPRLTINSSGYVGIGTTTPQTNLSIVGNTGQYLSTAASAGSPLGSSLYLGDTNFNNTSYYDSAPGMGAIYDASVNATGSLGFYTYAGGGAHSRSERIRILANGNVGIGTITPTALLQVSSNDANGSVVEKITIDGQTLDTSAAGSGQTIGFKANGGHYFGAVGGYSNGSSYGGMGLWTNGNSGSPSFYLNSTGSVGIGTTAPVSTLNVQADGVDQFTITGATNVNKRLRMGYDTTNNYGSIQALTYGSTYDNLTLNPKGGYVGVGTSAPLSMLHANGGPSMTSGYTRIATFQGTHPTFQLKGASDTNHSAFIGYDAQAASEALRIWVAGSTNDIGDASVAMNILANTNVGIGVSVPSEKLEVNGNIKATAFLYTSDRRLKTDIVPVKDPIEKILALQGVNFTWKATHEKAMGFIAQDVEKVLPEVVNTDKISTFKSVQYANIVSLVVEAFKSFYQDVNSHFTQVDRKLASVEEENKDLKARLDLQQKQMDEMTLRMKELEKKK